MAPIAENGTARATIAVSTSDRVQAQKHEHDEQRERDDVRETRAHASHRFELAAPEHRVAAGSFTCSRTARLASST